MEQNDRAYLRSGSLHNWNDIEGERGSRGDEFNSAGLSGMKKLRGIFVKNRRREPYVHTDTRAERAATIPRSGIALRLSCSFLERNFAEDCSPARERKETSAKLTGGD